MEISPNPCESRPAKQTRQAFERPAETLSEPLWQTLLQGMIRRPELQMRADCLREANLFSSTTSVTLGRTYERQSQAQRFRAKLDSTQPVVLFILALKLVLAQRNLDLRFARRPWRSDGK